MRINIDDQTLDFANSEVSKSNFPVANIIIMAKTATGGGQRGKLSSRHSYANTNGRAYNRVTTIKRKRCHNSNKNKSKKLKQ